MQNPSTFTEAHRADIAALCAELSERIGQPMTADYGASDCGQLQDAALCVDVDDRAPLVTIIVGPGISGGGFAVMAANGSSLAHDVSFAEALRSARTAGAREFRRVARHTRRAPR